jgi:hypothetical protein
VGRDFFIHLAGWFRQQKLKLGEQHHVASIAMAMLENHEV